MIHAHVWTCAVHAQVQMLPLECGNQWPHVMAKFNLVVFQSSAFTTLAKNVVQTHDANERFLPWEFLDRRSLLSLRYT